MPERYCSGKFSKQRGDVLHKATYGKTIIIWVKSPSGRVKDRVMLTKQKNGTYKVENTGQRRGTRRMKKKNRKKKRGKTYKRGGKRRRRRRTNKRRIRRS